MISESDPHSYKETLAVTNKAPQKSEALMAFKHFVFFVFVCLFLRNSRGAQRYAGFFLDCTLQMLIGRAGKLQSYGMYTYRVVIKGCHP